MAKVQFGPIITDARGKTGNTVYARNRGGAIIRQTPTYTQDLTPDVIAVRSYMEAIGKRWYHTLTDQQRTKWRTFGASILWSDCFRQPVLPAGADIFCQCNFNAINAGGNYINDPPDSLHSIDPGPLTCSASQGASTLTITPTNSLPPNHAFLVMATTPLNAGVYFFSKFLRQLRPQPTLLLVDTFPGPTVVPPWTVGNGTNNWAAAGNMLNVPSTAAAHQAIWRGQTTWNAYTVSIDILFSNGGDIAAPICWFVNPATGANYNIWFNYADTNIYLRHCPGWPGAPGPVVLANAAYKDNFTWHTWKIDATTNNIKVYRDEILTLSATDSFYTQGAIAIDTYNAHFHARNLMVQIATPTQPHPAALGSTYIAKFTSMTAGKKIGISLAYVNLLTGAKSPAQTALVTIAA